MLINGKDIILPNGSEKVLIFKENIIDNKKADN